MSQDFHQGLPSSAGDLRTLVFSMDPQWCWFCSETPHGKPRKWRVEKLCDCSGASCKRFLTFPVCLFVTLLKTLQKCSSSFQATSVTDRALALSYDCNGLSSTLGGFFRSSVVIGVGEVSCRLTGSETFTASCNFQEVCAKLRPRSLEQILKSIGFVWRVKVVQTSKRHAYFTGLLLSQLPSYVQV